MSGFLHLVCRKESRLCDPMALMRKTGLCCPPAMTGLQVSICKVGGTTLDGQVSGTDEHCRTCLQTNACRILTKRGKEGRREGGQSEGTVSSLPLSLASSLSGLCHPLTDPRSPRTYSVSESLTLLHLIKVRKMRLIAKELPGIYEL